MKEEWDSRKRNTPSRSAGTDKRKRWSVCGAEKRGDLELETIWEEAGFGVEIVGRGPGDGMGEGEMI